MTAFVIRLAEQADTETAIAVWRAARAARHGGQPAPTGYEVRVRDWMQQPNAYLIVAEAGNEVVGMGLAMPGRADGGTGTPLPGLCVIAMIYIAPAHWGKGLGKRVVDAVLTEAQARGYSRAQLWTAADNARAQRLYEGRGFRRTSQEYVNNRGVAEVEYERPL